MRRAGGGIGGGEECYRDPFHSGPCRCLDAAWPAEGAVSGPPAFCAAARALFKGSAATCP